MPSTSNRYFAQQYMNDGNIYCVEKY